MPKGTAAISAFANHLPVRIRFGDGRVAELPEVLASEGARRVLVLVDAGLENRSPAVAEAVAAVEAANGKLSRFVKGPGEPTVEIVDAATEAMRATSPDAIVAVGGGSVIDTAKAARLCLQRARSFAAVVAEPLYPAPDVPLIAVPTTAGTGSEVSGGAVVTDTATARKAGIAHPHLRAQHAIVDPVLTHSMSPATTAYTGIDALAQAVAGLIARAATPIGDAIALEAVRLIAGSLVAAYDDGGDAGARSRMACGSLMAGLTMNISDCTAEHSLAQAIGGLFHAPHGLTVGLVLAETLDRERRYVPEKLERVADAMGIADDGSNDGSRAVRGVQELLAQLGFPVLRSLGVEDSHLDRLAQAALDDFFHRQSPAPWSIDEVKAVFASALALESRDAARATGDPSVT
jgi:choline dehydrogenase